MHAVPRTVENDVPQVTGIACPDWRGVLAVRAEGHERNLSFLCKSGHTYDVTERLVAKAPAEPVLPMAGSPADRADEP